MSATHTSQVEGPRRGLYSLQGERFAMVPQSGLDLLSRVAAKRPPIPPLAAYEAWLATWVERSSRHNTPASRYRRVAVARREGTGAGAIDRMLNLPKGTASHLYNRLPEELR